jgi:ubiquinone/menaquinone biosynthesis C-methylase UbiE
VVLLPPAPGFGKHRSVALDVDTFGAERRRIAEEDRRRDADLAERYAPWQPGEIFMKSSRRRHAARLLKQSGTFPRAGDRCLEIGYGRVGWLADLLSWGLREADLHGVELDSDRAAVAREAFPAADLRVGDASELPWPDGSFRLVIASTVFTSILDRHMRRKVASEIVRVLAPGGALLWYDFAVDNPRNPNVRRVTRRELAALFPALRGSVRSVTLAPVLARAVAPHSWTVATLLEAVPFLRTHLVAVLGRER